MAGTGQITDLRGLSAIGTEGGVPGFQQITSLAGSTALTVPRTARVAVINVETQAVRMRADGTAPTAAIGVVVAAGDTLIVGGKLQALRFIEAAASAKLNVQYFR